MIKKNENKNSKLYTVCLLVCLALLLTACGQKETSATVATTSSAQTEIPEIMETAVAVEAEEENTMMIETSVCPIFVPVEVYENLEHMEIIQDQEIMEVFYLVHEEARLEVFRILFSPMESVNDIGILKMPEDTLFVSVQVSSYADTDFADETMKENYYTMVSALNTVLEFIQADERFADQSELDFQKSNVKLTYWEVFLPDRMEWEETVTQDYQVTFYSNFDGERVDLYSICIGETQLDSQFGYYYIDGQWKNVSLQSYEIPSTEGWADSQITELYTMMSTINDVIQSIMSSEQFAEELPE